MKRYVCKICGALDTKVVDGPEADQLRVEFECGRIAWSDDPRFTHESAPCQTPENERKVNTIDT